IALIADRPGQYILPALHLRWWNTTRDALQEVVMPPRTLAIGAAPAAPPVSAARGFAGGEGLLGAPAERDPWRLATVALGVCWLLTLGAWYMARRRSLAPLRTVAEESASTPGASRA